MYHYSTYTLTSDAADSFQSARQLTDSTKLALTNWKKKYGIRKNINGKIINPMKFSLTVFALLGKNDFCYLLLVVNLQFGNSEFYKSFLPRTPEHVGAHI